MTCPGPLVVRSCTVYKSGWNGTTAQLVEDEQNEFGALLDELTSEEWANPTLCVGWTVRDVVAHAAAHIHNEQQNRTIVAHFTRCPTLELVSWLRSPPAESDDPSWRTRRLFAEVQRGELMIHQQDVRRALARPRVIPTDRVTSVLSFGLQPIGSLGQTFARERVQGLRLESTESDWHWGSGKVIRGGLEPLLMATAGRVPVIDELDGPGSEVLRQRIANPSRTLADLIAFSEAATA